MTKRKLVMGVIGLCVISFGLGAFYKPLSPCQKLEAKIQAAESFCEGVADDYSTEACAAQTDDEKLIIMCKSMIEPTVLVKCLDKARVNKMKNDLLNFCSG